MFAIAGRSSDLPSSANNTHLHEGLPHGVGLPGGDHQQDLGETDGSGFPALPEFEIPARDAERHGHRGAAEPEGSPDCSDVDFDLFGDMPGGNGQCEEDG
jgi:hypothetical protein